MWRMPARESAKDTTDSKYVTTAGVEDNAGLAFGFDNDVQGLDVRARHGWVEAVDDRRCQQI